MKYCESIYQMKRRPTREILVGNIGVGGNNPIRIQSMTTSNTRDIEATIEQIIRLADAGCEIARVTVQGMKEADACEHIKNGLIQKSYTIPVVADIHFFPPAALRVADFVDKVRINPGNFVDKRASFKVIEYDDASYQQEIEKIEEKFTPLIEKCKKRKCAMRIGTNHGSLSDRIMNRYGDTPQGMVESALEFARVCRNNDYHDFMFSMKSSNPQVMVQAYRLLSAAMYELGWDYPLHLGVTEAGEGEDGRIKSAMGIGALLLEGIGDTIRVSLTEDPWLEIDPCKRLVHFAEQYHGKGVEPFVEKYRKIDEIKKRAVEFPKDVALHRDGTVFVGLTAAQAASPELYPMIGCDYSNGHPKIKVDTADHLIIYDQVKDPDLKQKLAELHKAGIGLTSTYPLEGAMQLMTLKQASEHSQIQATSSRFAVEIAKTAHQPIGIQIHDEPVSDWEVIKKIQPKVIFLSPSNSRIFYVRRFFEWMQEQKISIPTVLNFRYTCSKDDLIIQASTECGALLCDGLGDGVWLDASQDPGFLRGLSFSILQAARKRTFKTDFISCPSCGRTLFDLQDVSRRIRSRTSHLPGVKIAIMGCIVNGPGEMADADFGYVGSKPGMIDLYVGKKCVEKDIAFGDADDRLVELIKSHGRWAEPEESNRLTLAKE